jgi:threonine/homoserine/homoserine lactone efflux protein
MAEPKAWIASISGMAAFTAEGTSQTVWWFAAIYFVICFLSLACRALAGVYFEKRQTRVIPAAQTNSSIRKN